MFPERSFLESRRSRDVEGFLRSFAAGSRDAPLGIPEIDAADRRIVPHDVQEIALHGLLVPRIQDAVVDEFRGDSVQPLRSPQKDPKLRRDPSGDLGGENRNELFHDALPVPERNETDEQGEDPDLRDERNAEKKPQRETILASAVRFEFGHGYETSITCLTYRNILPISQENKRIAKYVKIICFF